MQTTSCIATALAYHKQHISVIPSDPLTKRPLVRWTEYQKRLATGQEIKSMWSRYPSAMISIITGFLSGIMVIDCDSQEAIEKIESLLPDSFETTIAISPRGGRHYYFKCTDETIQTKAGVLKNIDVRANGGCIVAPPSKNDKGGQYRWLNLLTFDKDKLQDLPKTLLELINSKQQKISRVQEGTEMFVQGRRDDDLFHITLALQKGGLSDYEITQTLKRLTIGWEKEFDEKWINTKIESAKNFEEKKEVNLTQEIRDWICETQGIFTTQDIFNFFNIITRKDKNTIYQITKRMIEEQLIERTGDKNGLYKKLNKILERIDWESEDEEPLDIQLPLAITDYCNINHGNIIVVAGCKDAGKSAFALNTALLNVHKYNIKYYSSEMFEKELKRRHRKIQIHLNTPFETLRKINYFRRTSDFEQIIEDEKNTIHIIDYLDVTKDFYMVGDMIKKIFDKLRHSVCLIALQKDFGKDLARGGATSLDKARLYLTLERGKAKIISGKDWAKEEVNPAGLQLDYKLIQGCKFVTNFNWRYENESYDNR